MRSLESELLDGRRGIAFLTVFSSSEPSAKINRLTAMDVYGRPEKSLFENNSEKESETRFKPGL